MRQVLVAGNWKMNGTLETAHSLIGGILVGVGRVKAAEVVVCPPFVYLEAVSRLIADSPLVLGAQNVSHENPGAFTGEVAVSMLEDFDCRYVIVGHSERRALYGETDERVAAKCERVLNGGLTPIVCVGETLEEREAGETEQVVDRQLASVIERVSAAALGRAVVAYEPVWAIGTGATATPEQAQEMHAFIRQRVARENAQVAEGLRILYGGSVKSDNAEALFAMPDIDGGLIGGASLKAQEFLSICTAAGA
ncbi:MAG: triose-phosphate isomerase [Gammaproteobacteria bacterium]|nr:triose-phosphate isomerase [Gammaproteobacteria bacterium]NIR82815.1 triose-phosphate isomerase [Gammaproteobacteria bacterium]NIR89924.1 triose-phosphate isomerase [Gammaproteobacteria bacterium]NIU03973.1 triose-phosphate isomerase [Gammaproteobacteria bacterium]NIV51293.1 triose-phosphate isomerase [Gammaproteobacteria bacterium]